MPVGGQRSPYQYIHAPEFTPGKKHSERGRPDAAWAADEVSCLYPPDAAAVRSLRAGQSIRRKKPLRAKTHRGVYDLGERRWISKSGF